MAEFRLESDFLLYSLRLAPGHTDSARVTRFDA